LRIAIDVSSAIREFPGGIDTAILEFVRGLSRVAPEDRFDLCIRFSRLKRWHHIDLPAAPNLHQKILFERLPVHWLYPRRIDVFHGADVRLPKFDTCPLVATVYDTFSLVSADFAKERFRQQRQKRYRDISRRADCIITPSQNTRLDVVRHLGCDAERVHVVPLGVSGDFRPQPADRIENARTRLGVKENYLLFVGAICRRKNAAGLVRAFGRMHQQFGAPLQLVLVGRASHGAQEALAAIEEAGLGDDILMLPHVDRSELVQLYAGARCFLLPSFYEGFGLPVLEAMACGAPVVVANTSSLPEVAGDAAIQVDPLDGKAIADAALSILSDASLSDDLRRRGLARAQHFSWDETARRTLDIYRRAAGSTIPLRRRAASGRKALHTSSKRFITEEIAGFRVRSDPARPFEELADLLRLDEEALRTLPNVRIISHGRHAVVLRVERGDGTAALFWKEYYPRHWHDSFRERSLGPSKGMRAWEGAARLQSAGVDTAPLVAAGECRRGALRGYRSFIVTEEIADATDVHSFLHSLPPVLPPADRRRKRALMRALGRLVATMHNAGLSHGDMRPGNIFCRFTDDDRPHLCLIDTDRVIARRSVRGRNVIRNLVQVSFFVGKSVSLSDRMRMFAAYGAARGLDRLELSRTIGRAADKLRRRLAKRTRDPEGYRLSPVELEDVRACHAFLARGSFSNPR